MAVQSSSVLRVWHIRISVYDSECESRRDSEDLCSERGVCALAPGEVSGTICSVSMSYLNANEVQVP